MSTSYTWRPAALALAATVVALLGPFAGAGQAGSPVLLKDINSALGVPSNPSFLANVNGTLYFNACSQGTLVMPTDCELWKSDGTTAGTVRVKDIFPGTTGPDANSSSPVNIINFNGTVLFMAADAAVQAGRPYKSTGAVGNATAITGTAGNQPVTAYFIIGTTAYFGARDSNPGFSSQLTKTDGTTSTLVKTIATNTGDSIGTPPYFANLNGILIFPATDGTPTTAGQTELWRSDGTSLNTVLLKDIYTGNNPDTGQPGSSSPSWLTTVGNVVFFAATNLANGTELWKTDGTGPNTVLVKDIFTGLDVTGHQNSSNPTNLFNYNGILLFNACAANGCELWRSDGTGPGTVQVKDIEPGANGSGPFGFTQIGSTVFFTACPAATGCELYKTDGTLAGTGLVKDIVTGPTSSLPQNLTAFGSLLFFTADDGVHGRELWQSNGTAGGTMMVADIRTTPSMSASSDPQYLTQVGSMLFFSADDGVNGRELWMLQVAVDRFATGAGPGGGPHVRVFDALTGAETASFFAFASGFPGGVRVALGDINGDGIPDVIAGAGPGGGPHVRVFDGATGAELASFFPYPLNFTGGVFVAAGDVNGDGKADIITGAGPGGGPHVRVFSGANPAVELASFFAYAPGFTGGVSVAAGDVNGDGKADIITGAGPGGGPHVRVFNGVNLAELLSFFPYPLNFTGGVFVAAGDVNADGKADIITGAGPGGGPHVRVFNGVNLAELLSFFPYPLNFTGGVFVAATDVNGDGKADIITGAGPGGGPHVRAFNGVNLAELLSFFPYPVSFTGGVFVAGTP